MKTKRKNTKARTRSKNPQPKKKDERPPVGDYWDVLDWRTYFHDPKRWVALCAVKHKSRAELKLYDWVWKGEKKGWKLGWANTNVAQLDLAQVAAESKELAAKYHIRLEWA